MIESGEAFLRKTLAEAVVELVDDRRLFVAEVAADGITTFELYRDEAGTPCGKGRRAVRWGDADEWEQGALVRATKIPRDARVILVGSHPSVDADQAMSRLRAARPDAAVFTEAGAEVRALLREVIEDGPLQHAYDLVVLKEDATTGRPELGCEQLFSSGTRRGETVTMTLQCAPSDDHGTVFAVVTWKHGLPTPVSIDVAKVSPGRYEVTAELRRPGKVTFTGLSGLRRDHRNWNDIVAQVPPTYATDDTPAHLICAVETAGATMTVGERLGRVRQMINAVSAELAERARVSLVVYGSHSYDKGVPDRPVEVLSWMEPPASALRTLADLEERPFADDGFPGAAQLEDMLAMVADRLAHARASGRTVLLTLGGLPPHPPSVHRSEILPCPYRRDWEQEVRRLKGSRVKLGAICDRPVGEVWHRLGGGAPADLNAVDVRRLCVDLGLVVPPGGRIPFPLLCRP